MQTYRCYLFNQFNRIDRVIEFAAASDAEACEEADRLYEESGHGMLELWRGQRKVYCPGAAEKRRA
jgi:hypothetical protein